MNMNIVSAVWIFHDEQLLLIFHRKHRRWMPVGGHGEPGEDPAEVAIREVKEEVGLDIHLLGLPFDGPAFDDEKEGDAWLPLPVLFRKGQSRNGPSLFYDFIAVADDISALNVLEEEIEAMRWLNRDEIDAVESSDSFRKKLRYVFSSFDMLN